MKKFLFLLWAMMLLSACQQQYNQTIPTQEQYKQQIAIESSDDYLIFMLTEQDPLIADDWYKQFRDSFVYVQIIFNSANDNNELTSRINDLLHSAQVDWIKAPVTQKGKPDIPEIRCHSEQYLSLLTNIYYSNDLRISRFCEGITVDLNTGARVFLNDIVDVNNNFITLIKNGSAVIDVGDSQRWRWRSGEKASSEFYNWLLNIPDEELFRMLADCSISMEQYFYKNNNADIDYYQLYKSSFYLENGKIVIILKENLDNETHLVLDINKMEDYLKVPKW